MYGRNRYKQARVNTAQPGDLVVMLYDGITRFIGDAERALEQGDVQATGRAVQRAIDIIQYLQGTLREDAAPELTASLDRTYAAWSMLLLKARGERDVNAMVRIREQVADLREGWAQANREAKSGELPRSAA